MSNICSLFLLWVKVFQQPRVFDDLKGELDMFLSQRILKSTQCQMIMLELFVLLLFLLPHLIFINMIMFRDNGKWNEGWALWTFVFITCLNIFRNMYESLTACIFCQRYFGWNRTKTDESLFPVLKQLNAQQVITAALFLS